MTFEVTVPRLGQLRSTDVRRALGRDWTDAAHVDVVVLAEDGGLPSATRVELGLKRCGRASHLALVCAGCGHLRDVLLVDGEGGLRCQRTCLRTRLTRQQRERTMRAWTQLGAKEEDALVRLLHRPHVNEAVLRRAENLVQELEQGDVSRVLALQPAIDAALLVPRDEQTKHRAGCIDNKRLSAEAWT